MRDLKSCRIQDLDDIFYSTKESQGTNNALLAIKYVLFDDESALETEEKQDNKFLYISSANNARKKAMILQKDDLAHMVIKYCMQSFGLRGKDFIINDDEFILIQKRIEKLNLSAYEMIEVIAYAAMVDIYKANELLYANHQLLIDVVDYMLNERYISELKDTLDNFSGIIDNKEVSTEKRYSFYDAYINIDEHFSELKRNDPDYIK